MLTSVVLTQISINVAQMTDDIKNFFNDILMFFGVEKVVLIQNSNCRFFLKKNSFFEAPSKRRTFSKVKTFEISFLKSKVKTSEKVRRLKKTIFYSTLLKIKMLFLKKSQVF